MYENETILKMREPREDDPHTGPFAYNRVRVIGKSPVSHVRGTWEGADADGVILEPLNNFGGVLDEPYGKVNLMYEVESVPEPVMITERTHRIINANTAAAGQTPEEVFAQKAPGKAPEAGSTRGRTSPLGEPGGPPSTSPLDEPVKAPRRAK